jgi:hypothetical protein
LGKIHFALILKEAIALLKPETVANGFEACGLYPWDPSAIDYTKCLGKKYEHTAEADGLSTKKIKLQKLNCKTFLTCSENCPNLAILKDVHAFFLKSSDENLTIDEEHNVQNQNAIIIEEGSFTIQTIDNKPILHGRRDSTYANQLSR